MRIDFEAIKAVAEREQNLALAGYDACHSLVHDNDAWERCYQSARQHSHAARVLWDLIGDAHA